MTLLWLPVPRLDAITWTFAESPGLWRGWNSITMTKRFLMVLWWFPLVGSIPFLLNWVGCLIPSSGIPLLFPTKLRLTCAWSQIEILLGILGLMNRLFWEWLTWIN
ncbi:hypothetical protein LINPERPRIM_LOCUS4694 [Linum perenne]